MGEQMTGTERFTAQSFETAAEAEQIRLVPPAMARPFQGHTFQIRDDTGMKRLMKSVAEHGILEPALAFYNEEGELELISGHRRQKVALSLGLGVMPVLIRNVSRDQATILMGETNLMQREKVLPSEKGFTYQAMLEAIRRLPGTGGENEADELVRAKSRDILSRRIGESASQIQRFIRLIRLMPELLNLVDTDKLSMRTGLELTRLSTACQTEVFRIYQESGVLPTYRLSRSLTEMTEQGALKEEQLRGLILEEDRDEAEEVEKMTFKSKILVRMLSAYGSIEEREERIILGLRLLAAQEAAKETEDLNNNLGKEDIREEQSAGMSDGSVQSAEGQDRPDQDHPSERESEEMSNEEIPVAPEPAQTVDYYENYEWR